MAPALVSLHPYTLVPHAPGATPRPRPWVSWEYLLVQKQFPEGTCRWTYTFRGQVAQGLSGAFEALWGQLGADGWELVAVVAEETTSFYFKRRYQARRRIPGADNGKEPPDGGG